MKRALAEKILKQNRENYEKIAADFDKTRAFLWPEVEATAGLIGPKKLVLDVGCGNGRLFPFVQKMGANYIGFDSCRKLIEICQKKYGEKFFFVEDILNSKLDRSKMFPDKFDAVYCLAVLHHIPSHNLRLQALKNIRSLLKPDGILILSVWNLWLKKYLKYILKETALKIIYRSALDWKDCYVPYKTGNTKLHIFNRYHHAFCSKELTNLIKASGFAVETTKKTQYNLLIIARNP